MAIEQLKRATLLVPIHQGKPLTNELYRLRLLHLVDISTQLPSVQSNLRKLAIPSKEAEERLQKLELLLSILKPLSTTKRPFIEDFFPLPIQVTERELEELLTSFPVEQHYEECKAIESQRRALEASLRDTEQEALTLKDLSGLPWPVGGLQRAKKVRLKLALFPRIYWKALTQGPRARELLAWQEIPQNQGTGHYEFKNPQSAIRNPKYVRVLLAFLPQEEEEAIRLLNSYHYQEIALPVFLGAFSGRVEDRLKELEAERKSILERQEALKRRLVELTPLIPQLETLLGYWEGQR